jgi:hypothetical protein
LVAVSAPIVSNLGYTRTEYKGYIILNFKTHIRKVLNTVTIVLLTGVVFFFRNIIWEETEY